MNKLSALRLRDLLRKDFKSSKGICSNYIIYLWGTEKKYATKLMIQCCKELGIYSGDNMYPISCRNSCPIDAFTNSVNKWSIFTNYGRRRRRVRKLMIKKLKEILNE